MFRNKKIADLKSKIKNMDKLIEDQARTIEVLKSIVNSLEEDLACLRIEAFKNQKRTSRSKKSN